ncbi:MAG: hypothetical protein ACP6IS_07555 [Candidatus Asgardarchaeia archaeon]
MSVVLVNVIPAQAVTNTFQNTFVDEDGDGICDNWDGAHGMHNGTCEQHQHQYPHRYGDGLGNHTGECPCNHTYSP